MSLVGIDLAGVPDAKLILNSLDDSGDIETLDQDLVLVELVGDVFIDVSWYPTLDPDGTYHITVFRGGDWENPLDAAETGDADLAAKVVAAFAERHSSRLVSFSNTYGTHLDYVFRRGDAA